MLFAIYAYENMYGGLNGMSDSIVVDLKNEKEAEDYAREMSHEVMDSYSIVSYSFEENAYFEGLEEGTREWDEYIEECYYEDEAYDIWIVTDTKDKSNEELQEEFYNNKEEFVRKYCERV